MSHEEAHAHEHAGEGCCAHDQTAHFSPEERAAMRSDDVQAAKSVVLLMCGVFCAGLVLYSIVAWAVW